MNEIRCDGLCAVLDGEQNDCRTSKREAGYIISWIELEAAAFLTALQPLPPHHPSHRSPFPPSCNAQNDGIASKIRDI